MDRANVRAGRSPADAADSDEDGNLDNELKREQAETASPVCDTLTELADELATLRADLARGARAYGLGPVASGTSPVPVTPTTTDDERYRRMTRAFGLMARETLICGCHVHVSVASREEGVGVLDRIRCWLPTLTALCANSPYWQGEDSGFASYRTVVWGRWPTAGPTEIFGSLAAYDAAVDALVASGGVLDLGMVYYDAR